MKFLHLFKGGLNNKFLKIKVRNALSLLNINEHDIMTYLKSYFTLYQYMSEINLQDMDELLLYKIKLEQILFRNITRNSLTEISTEENIGLITQNLIKYQHHDLITVRIECDWYPLDNISVETIL